MPDSTDSQHSEASPQHTPGPWHRCEAQPDAIVGPRCTEPCRICDDLEPKFGEDVPDSTYSDHFGGHFVCESVSSTANFNLIAAAPKMLVACQAVVRWAKEAEQRKVTMPMWCGLLWDEAIGNVNVAIAEAQGQQP